MKKLVLFTLILALATTAMPIFAAGGATLEVDGVSIPSSMLFTDSTAYIPLSEIAELLNLRIDRDEKTQSVFVNGINLLAEKGSSVSVYVNGKKYIPTDNTASPIVQNGEVYLPAHLAAEAFGKSAVWYKETATLSLFTKATEVKPTAISADKIYTIINRATGQALTAGENSLSVADFTKAENQKFKFIATDFEGYYSIQSVLTGNNLDVNAHGTTPGVSIITWAPGTGDNQKFTLEAVPGGTLISARSCHLPIEPKGSGVLQNSRTEADSQKWIIEEFELYKEEKAPKAEKLEIQYTPPVAENVPQDALYRTFSIGDVSLTDSDGLKLTPSDSSDAQKWVVSEHTEGVYIIENLATKKSVDVNARSLVAGDPIITWQTSRDTNQRWILEKNGDGTYYIKSAHSDLYLTATDDNTLIQQTKDMALKQRWTITGIN